MKEHNENTTGRGRIRMQRSSSRVASFEFRKKKLLECCTLLLVVFSLTSVIFLDLYVPKTKLDSSTYRSAMATFLNHHRRGTSSVLQTVELHAHDDVCGDGGPPPWANSPNLPIYIVEYLQWHAQMRCKGQQDVIVKYLLVKCTSGGIADRLANLPTYILLAHKMNRVLLLQWASPFPLEEFLTPHGINWTVPEWLQISNNLGHTSLSWNNKVVSHSEETVLLAEGLQLAFEIGRANYDTQILQHHNDSIYTYDRIYHDLFHSVFKLVPAIQSIVDHSMKQLSLTQGNYTSIHLRARHPNSNLPSDNTLDKSGGLEFSGETKQRLVGMIQHAVNCAANLSPGLPIFFASDSHHAVNYVLKEVATKPGIPQLVGLAQNKEPLHFDTPEYKSKKPSDFYPTFVDFLLLGMSRCTAYGTGGYGRLAVRLSYNSSCKANHHKVHC